MTQLHEAQRRGEPIRRYVAPASLSDALAILAELGPAARPVAGGTDLLLELSRGARPGVEALVDLSAVAGLDAITLTGNGGDPGRDRSDSGQGQHRGDGGQSQDGRGDGGPGRGRVELGPLVTHGAVVGHDRLRAAALPLAQACLEVGGPPLRNRATVAGNVVTASPANDTISALMALGAELTLASVRGERTVTIADFFTGYRTTALAPDELVTKIAFDSLGVMGSPDSDRRGVFVKLGLRRAQAISVVHAAAVVRFGADGSVQDLTLALGSVGPVVATVPAAADLALGRCLEEAAAEVAEAAAASVEPMDDLRATARYRTRTVKVAVERALRALAAGTEASSWPASPPRLAASGKPVRPGPRRDLTDADEVAAAVNGRPRRAAGAASATLLDWLRDELGLTGTKEGCAEGECGACTVHLDGRAVLACLTPAARADGSEVVTVEGLAADGALHPVQAAMQSAGGVQCGFCTPGFVMSAAKLIEEAPSPTDEQVEHGLSGNLCRCTGYYPIIAAVKAAAAAAGVDGVEKSSAEAGGDRAAEGSASAEAGTTADAAASGTRPGAAADTTTSGTRPGASADAATTGAGR